MDAEALAALDAAVGLATGRRQAEVSGIDLLRALTRMADSPVGTFLARYGASAGNLNKALATTGPHHQGDPS